MKVALQRHHASLQKAIVSNGGEVFQIVGDAFCAAFPMVLSAVAAAVTGQQALHLKEGIRDKNLLVVLENREHLIQDVASLAAELLSACSRLKILATSRESLRILGEWLYAVPAFDLPTESSSMDVETACRLSRRTR